MVSKDNLKDNFSLDTKRPTVNISQITTKTPPRSRTDTTWKIFQTALAHVKAIRWARLGRFTLYFAWLSVLVYFLILLQLWETSPWLSNTGTAYAYDDTFNPFDIGSRGWTREGFFQITIRMGSLSFGQAKILDIACNLVVGREGQALFAYLTWKTVSNFVARSMEMEFITYDAFSTVFIIQDSSFLAICRILTDRTFYRSLRSKIFMAFVFLSLTFILMFPTAVNSMTGYVGKTAAFIATDNKSTGEAKTYVKFSEFNYVEYIIHDASRLNLTDDLIVEYEPNNSYPNYRISNRDPILPPMAYSPGHFTVPKYGCNDSSWTPCHMSELVYQYVRENGRSGLNKTYSKWGYGDNAIPISPPSLNISWHPNYMTYSIQYIAENGLCQPIPDIYQWGFSYMQLVLLTISLLLWTLAMYIISLSAQINLPLEHREIPTRLKSFLHIASAITLDFSSANITNPQHLTNRQTEQTARKHLKGGNVSFQPLALPKTPSPNFSSKQWLWQKFKPQKWWYLAFFCQFGATILAFYAEAFPNQFFNPLVAWLCSLITLIAILNKAIAIWTIPFVSLAAGVNYVAFRALIPGIWSDGVGFGGFGRLIDD